MGDSDYLPSMNDLKDITVALLPIMGRAVMDVDEAVEAAIGIAPEMAIPVHWSDSDPEEFKAKAEARSDLKVVLIQAGETLTLI